VFGLPVLFLIFSTGCATVGQDFPVLRVSEIQVGTTTQDEIRAMFGSPWRVGIEDGQRTWTYGKYRYGFIDGKSAKDLIIRFDRNNVVSSYTFNTTEHTE
jgi:outer membrane protein assembly factor BamE (lipoprotein component of BamABCDE complex)